MRAVSIDMLRIHTLKNGSISSVSFALNARCLEKQLTETLELAIEF